MTSPSEHQPDRLPPEVQQFADGLCDSLQCTPRFWEYRVVSHRGVGTGYRLFPPERFVVMCLREKMCARYHWSQTTLAKFLGISHGSLYSQTYKQCRAMFEMYPDLRQAVINADGYDAAKYIFTHFEVAVRAACGQMDLRATG
jgi:hypothetical protein